MLHARAICACGMRRLHLDWRGTLLLVLVRIYIYIYMYVYGMVHVNTCVRIYTCPPHQKLKHVLNINGVGDTYS
jgi:hypothetical protein